jgi:hypothetical protein
MAFEADDAPLRGRAELGDRKVYGNRDGLFAWARSGG